jgi:hypothetical protein
MILPEEPPDFLATRPPREWHQGIARWNATPPARQSRAERDQRLTCRGGICVGLHQHRRHHGQDGRADSSSQRVADSGQDRQVRDE